MTLGFSRSILAVRRSSKSSALLDLLPKPSAESARKVADIYAEYERQLKSSNALDFDDLLLRTAKMLRENPNVREIWQNRFQYLHVDEYQDTNRVQYDLMRLLTNAKQNLCVVGDGRSIHL